jgi:hypothetical protein
MKKFGTPIGAAPGNANENVGLSTDGAPPAPCNVGTFVPGLFDAETTTALAPVAVRLTWCDLLVELFCVRLSEIVGGSVVVATVTEVCPVPVPVPVPVVLAPVVLVPVPVAEVEPPAAHDSSIVATGVSIGSETSDSGKLAGSVSVKTVWLPAAVVTVSVHVCSAAAAGIAARPHAISAVQMLIRPRRNIRFRGAGLGLLVMRDRRLSAAIVAARAGSY